MFRRSRNQTTLDDLMLMIESINDLAARMGAPSHAGLLLGQALTHRSALNEGLGSTVSYERLEFLGDSVLALVISQQLLTLHPTASEGELSKLRSAIVNEETLARVALHLGLPRLMVVGRGERAQLHQRTSILADAVEALVGALYLSAGVEAAGHWIVRELLQLDGSLFSLNRLQELDAKSRLQEFTLQRWQTLPEYRELNAQGEIFRLELRVKGKALLCAQASSKKKAQQHLAQACLAQDLLALV